MNKVKYLAVDFDGPPSGDQLEKQFGSEGWCIVAMMPYFAPPVNGEEASDDIPPLQKLRAYFTKESDEIVSTIMLPVGK